MTMLALSLFLAEGFALSVFPVQFKEFLQEAEPRMLQVAGLVETLVAAGLFVGLWMS
jgi:hypothetical protein